MLSFAKGSRLNGGIANNKWDENRMTNPWTVKQRQSGINNPYMRFSDIILMQAEIKAALGKDGEGRQLLEQIRTRAFGSAALAKTDEFIRECGGLLSACIEERKFEFGGEGSRKFDLIRTNKLETAIAKYQLFRDLIDSHGFVDEQVLDKLKFNIRSLLESESTRDNDLLDLCLDVIYHANMKSFGLQQLIVLFINWNHRKRRNDVPDFRDFRQRAVRNGRRIQHRGAHSPGG